jgi:hypothetical protein
MNRVGTQFVLAAIVKETGTNSVQLSTGLSGDSLSAIKAFPYISWNPNVHYRVHKNLPRIPILSQTNPVHNTTSYFSKINFNIIFPPTSSSS